MIIRYSYIDDKDYYSLGVTMIITFINTVALTILLIICLVYKIIELSKDDMKIISKILNDEVILTEDISKTIFNIKTTTDLLEKDLPYDFNLIDLSIYRKGNNIGVTLWK
jgi:hypothetical protein